MFVTPRKRGSRGQSFHRPPWVPAFAGVTIENQRIGTFLKCFDSASPWRWYDEPMPPP